MNVRKRAEDDLYLRLIVVQLVQEGDEVRHHVFARGERVVLTRMQRIVRAEESGDVSGCAPQRAGEREILAGADLISPPAWGGPSVGVGVRTAPSEAAVQVPVARPAMSPLQNRVIIERAQVSTPITF